MNKYGFGICKKCKQIGVLKDELCLKCQRLEMPEFFKNIFNDTLGGKE